MSVHGKKKKKRKTPEMRKSDVGPNNFPTDAMLDKAMGGDSQTREWAQKQIRQASKRLVTHGLKHKARKVVRTGISLFK